MIKFFRHIRRSLLNENKMGKYFKYAIGEILLVVIGILIALQINNWNESRKIENEINQTVADLEKDLINNHKEAQRVLKFYYKLDSLTKLGIYNKLKKEDYYNNQFLNYLTTNWYQFRPKTSNIIKLIDFEKDAKAEYKPIIEAAKLLRDQKIDLDSNWDHVAKTVNDEMEFNSKYLFTLAKDSINKAAKIDYFLNDPEYEKRLSKSWAINQVYYDNVSRYLALNLGTLLHIKQINSDFDTAKIKQVFAEYNMSPFKNADCSESLSTAPQYKMYRASHLLANVTKDTVFVNIHFDKKRTSQHILEPYQTARSNSYFLGIDGSQNALYEQIDKQGNCIRKFKAVQHGYLIID
ncbi:DUF6090 family protein [Ichthyenterobacterium sp. W332]|uniref:DUF6090 family protein n=1 Tax=Microcosmobacter mediterraneus TaxID=3075607 RepID=A0ABU2YMK5_9FLAO|nr:DUF6090 family protein [Ichthyenterobacterium sp. W332]MDT0558298.1 DUF6090 family protein [Ichthyenterobacterium sp. W332]